MRLEFSPAARSDLAEIASYIARDNPSRAFSFVEELEQECRKLSDYPNLGISRSDLREGLRAKYYGVYLILYRPLMDLLKIERIIHGARNLDVVIHS